MIDVEDTNAGPLKKIYIKWAGGGGGRSVSNLFGN